MTDVVINVTEAPVDVTAAVTETPVAVAISATSTPTSVNIDIVDSGASVAVSATSTPTNVTINAQQGIEEAPIDGTTYGRQDAGWVEVTSDPQVQSDWNQVDSLQVDFIKNKPTDAPSDGETYGRKDAAWVAVESVPAGGTTGQVLTKQSGTDYDVIWATVAAAAFFTEISPYLSTDLLTIVLTESAKAV